MNHKNPTAGKHLAITYMLVAALMACTLLLTIPGGIFLANQGDFMLGLADLLMFMIPLFIIAMLFAALVFAVVPNGARPVFVSFVFAIAALIWLQANVLVWDYGPLDGRSIAWEDHRTKGYIDSSVWIFLVGISLIYSRILLKTAVLFSTILLAASLLQFGIAVLNQPDKADAPDASNYQIDDSSKFSFSSNKNVIIIVLDAFQSDIFQEVIQDPEYAKVFDKFTYFPDALAGSNFTQVAIPALLTGTLYDNSQPRSDYMRDAFLEFGVTTLLKSAGYVVDIYPWVGWGNESIYFHENIASNLVLRSSSESRRESYSEPNAKEVLNLIDLSLFRSAPHFLKPVIYNDQKWFTSRLAMKLMPTTLKQAMSSDNKFEANVFVREASRRISVGDHGAVLKYYHLKGAHRPLSVKDDLTYTSEIVPFSRENYITSVKANILSIGQFLEILESDGVFDKSLLIIAGDHGSGNTPDVYIGEDEGKPANVEKGHNYNKNKARGVPLFLVKRIGASGPLVQNDAPVSLMDIPATVIAEMGIDAPAAGRSVFEIDPAEARLRTYGAFDYTANRSDYIGPITVYDVNGNSWLDASWTVRTVQLPGAEELP